MALNRGILIAISAAILFGLHPSAARYVYADGGNAVFMIILTTLIRAAMLYGFCLIKHKKVFQAKTDVRNGVIGGAFQALSIICIFLSLTYLPGPVVIIINFTHTLMLLLFLAWKKHIKLDSFTVTITLTALAGLSLVLDIWNTEANTSLIGIALAFTAAIATMSRVYLFGQLVKDRDPAIVGAESFLLASVFVLLSLFMEAPQIPQTGEGIMWALAGGTTLALATFGMFYGIAHLGAFRFSLYIKLEPIFTALLSIWLLHEFLNIHQYLGIALVTSSLIVYQYVDNRRKVG